MSLDNSLDNSLDHFEFEEIDNESLFNKRIFILTTEYQNEDTFSDEIIINIIENQPYLFGTILSNSSKIDNFYKKYTIDDVTNGNDPHISKIKESFIYKRYTFLLNKKIFKDNSYMILDSYMCSKAQFCEINKNLKDKQMMVLFSYENTLDVEIDYIFICSYQNKETLEQLYDKYHELFKIIEIVNFEEFYDLICCCVDDKISIIIETTKKNPKILCYQLN